MCSITNIVSNTFETVVKIELDGCPQLKLGYMDPTFRLLDFKVANETATKKRGQDSKEFVIQMFGIDECGKSYSVFVKDFQPFFYVKVGDGWGIGTKTRFLSHIKRQLRIEDLESKYKSWKKNCQVMRPVPKEGESRSDYVERCLSDHKSYYESSIVECKIIRRKKLYGFDQGKDHKFVLFKFKNTTALNKVKNLWYDRVRDRDSLFGIRYILKTFEYQGVETELYEAKLPPLLRYFHIQKISPSGWVKLPRRRTLKSRPARTYCDFEYTIHHKYIIPLPEKETAVPAKICSFDIEASSSHGDFPVAVKTYKKLIGEIITYWNQCDIGRLTTDEQRRTFTTLILSAFKHGSAEGVSEVYPKRPHTRDSILERTQRLLHTPLREIVTSNLRRGAEDPPEKDDLEDDELYDLPSWFGSEPPPPRNDRTILDYLSDSEYDKGKALEIIDQGVKVTLPALEGDKVTFIGSTFRRMGESEPYLNHCVALGTCDDIGDQRTEIEEYATEEELLLGWTALIRREKPDIVIGYNIFGFDWKFLCERARENGCFMPGRGADYDEDELWFSELSKNRRRYCKDQKKTIKIASGTHELTYIDIDGIIQLDLYNYFRREVNLSSYKLNDVASHFIGDMIKEFTTKDGKTSVRSGNLTGLQKGNYVCFDVIGHSSDAYRNGKKFEVVELDEEAGVFQIDGVIDLPKGTKLRWGLGKDDVSPQEIFEKTNGTSADRAVIAKYCLQDCNLLHHLVRKNDILTGMSEIASICSIPIDFVVMRGQGIKLLSFIAKKCRDKRTLMPVMDKPDNDGSYEGAICLDPKTGLYLKDPVAVVDFASLYPSSMISENISHDSKVWTKEYDIKGRMIEETGDPAYDGLEGYEYVDVEYDTYDWVTKEGRKKKEKVKVGTKVCRFAQFPDGKKAIMPAILQELLAARKATRAKIRYQTVTMKNKRSISGQLKDGGDHYLVTEVALVDGSLETTSRTVSKADVQSIGPTYDSFMRNVFNKRQLGYKITANSLYGQCGAVTSSFYEKDIAASTTATGRKLLIYAKKVIEDVYRDRICSTKYGDVRASSDVVYGDTDSCFFTFHLEEMDGTKICGKRALEITIELAIEVGQLASKFLKSPHDLEYEKTFWPFLLLSKKRYVGLLYEHDVEKCQRKSMGIVLKRRDNAPIVKDVYGGIIDILMNEKDIGAAVSFTRSFLNDIVDEKFPLEKLIISKSLKGFYKNPGGIAHKVLADRMAKRDPGNKPSTGSRIPYVFIQTKKKVKLQGNRIETPTYIRANKLRPDYIHYITNQIKVPVQQVFSLILEDIPDFQRRRRNFEVNLEYLRQEYAGEADKLSKKEGKLRAGEVSRLIFEDALRKAKNIKDGQSTVRSFFG